MSDALLDDVRQPQTEPARPSGRGGLTLLEVVFASAILAIFLLGVFSSMAHCMRMETLAREREAATRTALRQLEDRVLSVMTESEFDTIKTLTESFDVPVDEDTTPYLLQPAQVSPNPSGRTGLLTVSVDATGTYNGIDHLIVANAKVRWRAVDGSDQEVVIQSMKSRPQ